MAKPITQQKLRNDLGVISRGFDFIEDPVVIADPRARILYANSATEKAIGYNLREMKGKKPSELWGGRMNKKFYESLWDTINNKKKPFMGEVENIAKNGTPVWQELHVFPVLEGGGNIKFFICVSPVITARKKREQFQEEFAAFTSHQLKNPISSVLLNLELLIRLGHHSEEEQESLKSLRKGVLEMSELINDLRTISQSGSIKYNSSKFSLDELIGGVLDGVRKKYPTIRFIYKISGQECPISGNKILISQVFLNLIDNAAKYSDKGGVVRIKSDHKKDACIFSCQNTGAGISRAERAKVFTHFFRGANALQAHKSGTGLGLFLIKMIADSLGWEVSFKSRRQDTTFFVNIPCPKETSCTPIQDFAGVEKELRLVASEK